MRLHHPNHIKADRSHGDLEWHGPYYLVLNDSIFFEALAPIGQQCQWNTSSSEKAVNLTDPASHVCLEVSQSCQILPSDPIWFSIGTLRTVKLTESQSACPYS